jgi:sugar phosphate isomerase/epimerase
MAKKDFGIDGVEWVNQFWKDKATDAAYVAELKKICEGEGVTSVLIMCDGEGHLGDPDDAARGKAVDNHKKWIEAAKALGCHSIRVNAHTAGKGTREEQAKRAVDGLRRLSEVAAPYQIGVIVENHGQLSSDGGWLAGVMKDVGLKNCGTLPDFGNFRLDGNAEYDRYKGVDELMPYAKGVSAKSHDFNEAGEETHTDYHKMLDIVVKKHGWHGFIGIEYEGSKLGEVEGIKATKALLEKVRGTLKA